MYRQVKKWLNEPEHSKALLAVKLSLKTTATIDNWLATGRVPWKYHEKLERIFRK